MTNNSLNQNAGTTSLKDPVVDSKPDFDIAPGKVTERSASKRSTIQTRLSSYAVRLLAHMTPYIESEVLGLSSVVNSGDVCIDVGAAAGLYTLELSRLVGTTGKVLSVEPLTFAHPVLSRLLGVKLKPNVTPHTIALGADPGESYMRVPMRGNGTVTGRSFLAKGSSGLGSNSEFDQHMDVEVTVNTLDNLCTQENITRLDFIKIDIEGAELPALIGGQKYIEKFKPAILIEIEARHLKRFDYTPEDIVNWMVERGYKMYYWEQRWKEAPKVVPTTRNYLFRVD